MKCLGVRLNWEKDNTLVLKILGDKETLVSESLELRVVTDDYGIKDSSHDKLDEDLYPLSRKVCPFQETEKIFLSVTTSNCFFLSEI